MATNDQYTHSSFHAYSGALADLDAAGTVAIALLESTYSPDLDNHTHVDDVAADEHAETGGYERRALGTPTLTPGTNEVVFDAEDETWENSTITARYAVLFDDTEASDADKELLQLIDFETDEESDDGDFTVSWDAQGIFAHIPRPS